MPNRFLLEIGTEEIPDWMIPTALTHLRDQFTKLLETNKLKGEVEWVDATPRRLILRASGLPKGQKDSVEVVSGPPVSAGDGAKMGFAKKQGVDPSVLETTKTDKGEYFAYRKQVKGKTVEEILAAALPEIILSIPWPKTMYWTGKGGQRFIRPIRWMVALLQSAIVPFEIAGVKTDKFTRGHRRMGGKKPIPVTISNYEIRLRDNGVMVRAGDRREKIQNEIAALLPPGCTTKPDDALLDTLTFITEWPAAILGNFDESYLQLPQEILIEVMKHHQKYFSVLKSDGSLAPHFIAVMNTKDDPEGLVRSGNERVLRARFNDARFFWEKDLERSLWNRLTDLANVTFQRDLGSYFNKTHRILLVAQELTGRSHGFPKNIDLLKGWDGQDPIDRAALLCKVDLTTDMVKEFTDLQGIMGGLYAKAIGEPEAVAAAIYEHYKPLSMDDSIPASHVGQVIALADKLDTLREAFRIGMIPTGSKDPFALRRAAQGVIKILVEGNLDVPFESLCLVTKPEIGIVMPGGENRATIPATGEQLATLRDFFLDRVRYYFKDIRGFAYDEVNAVLSTGITTLKDVLARLEALQSVRATPDFEPLAAAFKRIRNILDQAKSEGGTVNAELLHEEPEKNLWSAVTSLQPEGPGYAQQLIAIASLRPAIDSFFDKVMVNAPDAEVRANRLALLAHLRAQVSRIADISEIVTSNA